MARPTRRAKVLGATAAVVAAAGTVAVSRRRRPPDELADDLAIKDLTLLGHGGTALHVRRFRTADGAPPVARVLFAHGWCMSTAFWESAARRLAHLGIEAVTWDQRGHGRSEVPVDLAQCSIDALGRDLEAVLLATAAPRVPTMLVGHSMGGMSIVSWASVTAATPNPDRPDVVGTVLWNTAFHAFTTDALAAIVRTHNPRVHRLATLALYAAIPIPRTAAALPVVRALAHGPGARREDVTLTHRLVTDISPRVRVQFSSAFESLDLREAVAQLDVPTVVVTGSRDLLTPPQHGQKLAEALPDARLLSLPGAGHQAPLDHPDVVVDLVLEGLRPHVDVATNLGAVA